ncbi:MAG: LON peptidase substrate-binding domain-containing protein, partial [Sphingomonadaceae bacterium]
MQVTLPVLPLRDIVVFPQMIVPLFVGREKSVKALELAMQGDKTIFLLSQKNPSDEDPGQQDLYDMGTVATVLQLLKLPDGTVKVLVEGQRRGAVVALEAHPDHWTATVGEVVDVAADDDEGLVLLRSVLKQFDTYAKQARKASPELANQLASMEDGGRLADTIAANLNLKIADRQALLSETRVARRLEMV